MKLEKIELRIVFFRMHKPIALMYFIGAIKLIEIEREVKLPKPAYEIRFSMKLRRWHPFSIYLFLRYIAHLSLKSVFKDLLEAKEDVYITTLGKVIEDK